MSCTRLRQDVISHISLNHSERCSFESASIASSDLIPHCIWDSPAYPPCMCMMGEVAVLQNAVLWQIITICDLYLLWLIIFPDSTNLSSKYPTLSHQIPSFLDCVRLTSLLHRPLVFSSEPQRTVWILDLALSSYYLRYISCFGQLLVT